MEAPIHHNLFDRRPIFRSKTPAVKWVREWVPQDVVATGGKCSVMKWVREDTLRVLKDKGREPDATDPEPEPTSEVLFLCSYEGCGKTFIDAGALRKHSHIHGERQYVCHYEGCGKKFLDSSKLKRHFLIHTGERDFVCPHEGCGKAFSLDFNLRSHMKTHSQENYHICPYADCGKRFAHEYKLKNHISSHHEKNPAEAAKYTPPVEKPVKTTKPSSTAYGSASSARPYGCPYEGCGKAYIHEYKLNLHLRREHPGHYSEDNNHPKTSQMNNNNNLVDNEVEEDQDAYSRKRVNGKSSKQPKHSKPSVKLPPSKAARKGSTNVGPINVSVVKKQPWPVRDEAYAEEDSEETEEDRDNGEDGWRYGDNNEDDDEETEYED
ncbi:hypothetical protein V2J09_002057 [Rumex salicifolius]